MALEEVSFYNLVGDEISLSILVGQMIGYYQAKREVGENKVTDFNEGSVIRNILEAFAVLEFLRIEEETEASKLPFISSSYGIYLDKIGENPFIRLSRITGSPSEGNVVFTLAFEQDNDFLIQADTLLEDDNGLQYVTIDDCTIYAGETTAEVGAVCLTNGYEGNIQPGQLTVIADESIDTNLVSVSNTEEFINGADYEDDEDYRTRLLENVRADGFGTIGWYVNLCENVPDVHDVSFVNAVGYTEKVLVNGKAKPTPDSVLLDVLAVLSDSNNHVLKHTFTVDKPTYVTVNLTFELSMLQEWTTDALTSFVTKMVNGGSFEQMEFTGLMIGENLSKSFMVDNFGLLYDVAEVTSIKVTGSTEFDSTDIDVDEVVKLGTLTFNQTVVGD